MVLEMSRHHAQLNRVPMLASKEQSENVEVCQEGTQRVGLGGRAKRVRSNVLDSEESDAWMEAEDRMGANPSSSPTSVSLPTTHRADLWEKRRIIDKGGEKETSQSLPQEWTGSTRFRKFLVLSDHKLAKGDR